MSRGFLDLLPIVAHAPAPLDSGKFVLANDSNMGVILTAAPAAAHGVGATIAA